MVRRITRITFPRWFNISCPPCKASPIAHFTAPETARYTREAFVKKYHTHGPGVLNMAMTAVRGYLRVKAEIAEREKSGMAWDAKTLRYVSGGNPSPNAFMRQRLDSVRRNALRIRPVLSSTQKYAPNDQAAEKCSKVMALYDEAFGPMTIPDRVKSAAVRLLAIRESRRAKKEGTIMRQPPMSIPTERSVLLRKVAQRKSLLLPSSQRWRQLPGSALHFANEIRLSMALAPLKLALRFATERPLVLIFFRHVHIG